MLCGHLLGKGWHLGSSLCCLNVSLLVTFKMAMNNVKGTYRAARIHDEIMKKTFSYSLHF